MRSSSALTPSAVQSWAADRPSPIIRWAGSKRKLIHTLAEYWRPNHTRYIEPFAGSSCLFFWLQPQRAILSDKNRELIETYEVLRECPVELHTRVTSFPATEQSYYLVRARCPASLPRLERAARFVFLNRFCFNGIFRTNSRGEFNVPYSPTKTGQVPPVAAFESCAAALQKVDLRACDFGTTLKRARSGDFVYLDPPFAVSSRRVFREYGARTFDVSDLTRFARHLDSLDSRGVSFLVSYADCKESRALLDKWDGRRIRVRRHIAGFTAARRTAYELLITNIRD
jgi:DNA adenine methylase